MFSHAMLLRLFTILFPSQVKIWDTAGSEKYMSISAVYYRKADGVIFVFDTTRPRSFTDIVSVWMNAVEAQERSVNGLLYTITD